MKKIEQYSKRDPQTMVDQFKQAISAKPDGIVITGHPGKAEFVTLVDQAEEKGIIVTSGDNTFPATGAQA